MVIVWRNEWINTYESPWSVFEKICLANNVTRTEVLRTLGNQDVKKIISTLIGEKRREFLNLNGFDHSALNQYLEYDFTAHNASIISTILKPVQYYVEHNYTWFPQALKWCPECMNKGYHSWLHQFSLVRHCPIHQVRLVNFCPECQNEIPFLFSDKGLSAPFTCKCGYKLADFTMTHWSEWNFNVNITENAVIKWIGGEEEGGVYDRLLFVPRAVSIEMFNIAPIISSKYLGPNKKATKSKREYSLGNEFRDEVYFENKRCFRAIDRYIQKKFLKKHRLCVLTLQELRKPETGEFPTICPYAYAYVFWKHTLLMTDQFIKVIKGDETCPRKYLGIEFATQLIGKNIIDLKNKLFAQTNFFEVDNRAMFHWIINRFTSEMCLNYFYQWLEIAEEGSKQIRVPDWNQITRMIEKSIPNIIFKHHSDVARKQKIQITACKETHDIKSKNIKCINSSKSSRKVLRQMKSYTPLSIAMKIFDNPSEENKILRKYVEQYVSRLTI